MASVFVKAPIDNDHIGQFRMFLNEIEDDFYGVCYLNNSSLKWECVDYYGNTTVVTHTISKIKLLNNDDILKEAENEGWVSYNEKLSFKEGANFILNKLNQG